MTDETLALARYSWAHHRNVLLGFVWTTVGGFALAGILYLIGFDSWLATLPAGIASCSLLALLFIVVGLFGFNTRASLTDPTSCYDSWLLRLPISDLKLALIPAGLVTGWIAMLWLPVAIGVNMLAPTDFHVPVISQWFGMCATAIFVISLTWRPFRGSWQRITILFLSFPLIYFIGLGCIMLAGEKSRWLPVAQFGNVILYPLSLAFAIHSVKLARVSAFQQTTSNRFSETSGMQRPLRPRMFPSAAQALRWHDEHRVRIRGLKMSCLLAPFAVLIAVALPLSTGTAIFAIALTSFMAMTIACSVAEEVTTGCRSSIVGYLATSPISNLELAKSRLISLLRIYCAAFLVATAILSLAFVWEENRVTAASWWAAVVTQDGWAAPYRIIVLNFLAVWIVSIGLLLRTACIQFYGRQWGVIVAATIVVGVFVVGLGYILAWFMTQNDWNVVKLEVSHAIGWMYYLYFAALIAKFGLAAIVIGLSKSYPQRFAPPKVLGLWAVSVTLFSTIAILLLPSETPARLTVVMATALAVPISPFFLAPIAVAENRHRSTRAGIVGIFPLPFRPQPPSVEGSA